MRHLEVLVFTNNTTIPRILNWKVSTVENVETAIEKLQQRPFKVLAISNEISGTDKIKLNKLMPVLFDDVILVEYKEDITLSDKVKTAYWSENMPGVENEYVDNSLEIANGNSISLN